MSDLSQMHGDVVQEPRRVLVQSAGDLRVISVLRIGGLVTATVLGQEGTRHEVIGAERVGGVEALAVALLGCVWALAAAHVHRHRGLGSGERAELALRSDLRDV